MNWSGARIFQPCTMLCLIRVFVAISISHLLLIISLLPLYRLYIKSTRIMKIPCGAASALRVVVVHLLGGDPRDGGLNSLEDALGLSGAAGELDIPSRRGVPVLVAVEGSPAGSGGLILGAGRGAVVVLAVAAVESGGPDNLGDEVGHSHFDVELDEVGYGVEAKISSGFSCQLPEPEREGYGSV